MNLFKNSEILNDLENDEDLGILIAEMRSTRRMAFDQLTRGQIVVKIMSYMLRPVIFPARRRMDKLMKRFITDYGDLANKLMEKEYKEEMPISMTKSQLDMYPTTIKIKRIS